MRQSAKWVLLALTLIVAMGTIGGSSWHEVPASPTNLAAGPFEVLSLGRCSELLRDCDVTDADCQSGVYHLMCCLLGELPSVPPRVKVVDLEELERVAGRGRDSESKREVFRERALQQLGLDSPPSGDLAGSRVGFYSFSDRTVYLRRDSGAASGAELAVLGHEFVHAIRHAVEPHSVTDSLDATTAWRAMAEGEAYVYEFLVRSMQNGYVLDNLRRGFELDVEGTDRAALTMRSLTRQLLPRFEVSYGAYAAARDLIELRSGVAAMPPKRFDTASLLGVRHGWAPQPYHTARPCARDLDGLAFLDHDRLGAWVAQVYFARLLGAMVEATDLVRSLRGDWMGYFGSVDSLAALWRLEWSDEFSAKRALSIVRKHASTLPAWAHDRYTVLAIGARFLPHEVDDCGSEPLP